jgi:hypothetical protein
MNLTKILLTSLALGAGCFAASDQRGPDAARVVKSSVNVEASDSSAALLRIIDVTRNSSAIRVTFEGSPGCTFRLERIPKLATPTGREYPACSILHPPTPNRSISMIQTASNSARPFIESGSFARIPWRWERRAAQRALPWGMPEAHSRYS